MEIKEKNIISKCAVLVNSCDKYKEAWNPFFELFNKFWPYCPFKIYLNTESEKYNNYDVVTLNSVGTWGQRLSNALNDMDEEYVIFLLEDFFLQKTVKEKVIMECLARMINNSQIGCFYFNQIVGYKSDGNDVYDGFFRMYPNNDYNDYAVSCQAALWKKDYLLKLCKNVDTAWDFEIKGYENNKEVINQHEIYCIHSSHHDKVRKGDVFSYILKREKGYGIWASKWLWNNARLFKKNGIKVEYSSLGIMTHQEFLIKYKITPFLRKMVSFIRLTKKQL